MSRESLAEKPNSSAVTARAMLFGDLDVAELGARCSTAGILADRRAKAPGLPDEVWHALDTEVGEIVAGFLEIDLAAVAMHGLRTYQELLRAAKATLESPDTAELVSVDGLEIRTDQHPHIELLVGTTPVATVALDVGVVVAIVGLVATVEHGRLTRLTGGRCTVTVSVAFGGEELLHRTGQLGPQIVIPVVAGGVPLRVPAQTRRTLHRRKTPTAEAARPPGATTESRD
jgi:hypothetical protein